MRYLSIFVCLLAVASSGLATIIHVPADQPTIQAGINAAVNGDTVLVGIGTYYEHLEVNKALTILSAGNSANTVIDGQGTMDDSTSSIFAIVGAGAVIIRGFTITGGRGMMNGTMDSAKGGGVYVSQSILQLDSCNISGNSLFGSEIQVIGGGGIFVDSTAHLSISYTYISNSLYQYYDTLFYVPADLISGGGIYSLADSVYITDCVFDSNVVGGDMARVMKGAAICLLGNYCKIYGCDIVMLPI